MAVNYSEIFTVTHPITYEPFTIFVETFTPMGGETLFVIKALEGEYDTREGFEDAREWTIQGLEKGYTRDKGDEKLYSSIILMRLGARHLVDSLNEALQFYEEN